MTAPITATTATTTPRQVVDFWLAAGRERWFAKSAAFDAEFRDRFADAHGAAAAGRLDAWAAGGAEAALALVLLLDQYPRNAFRDTPRMFSTDGAALRHADAAVEASYDRQVDPLLRSFFYMPFMHAEDLAAQQRCVALMQPLGGDGLRYAEIHRDAIARFGRFPHRNAILGRPSSPDELAYLADGGFTG